MCYYNISIRQALTFTFAIKGYFATKMFEKELWDLKEKGLLRNLKERESPQGSRIIINGRVFINFASNDYLGFSNKDILKSASADALYKYGTGAGASRLLLGGTDLHRILEKKTAEFKGTPSALILNSGYTANIGAIVSLADAGGEETAGNLIFSDELNHASIIDACRLAKAKVFIYRHKDTTHLEELLFSVRKEKGRRLIITDSVFSMDGDIAPIPELIRIAERYNALLYIDDAHATGVLGDGHGSLRHFGISHRLNVIQMGTFSKALGSFGAYVAGEESLISWLINKARPFIYSTALPPSVIGANLKALELIEEDKRPIRRLWSNREMAMEIFKSFHLKIGPSETPIIPVLFPDIEETVKFSTMLYSMGIYAPAIRPPTVKIPRIRFTITASHTEEDFGLLEKALAKIIPALTSLT
jgi:8-amino-7-oxononanoate synthase